MFLQQASYTPSFGGLGLKSTVSQALLQPCLGAYGPQVAPRSPAELLVIRVASVPVGNQHKWDRLGPEKIIIMKSCVGAP